MTSEKPKKKPRPAGPPGLARRYQPPSGTVAEQCDHIIAQVDVVAQLVETFLLDLRRRGVPEEKLAPLRSMMQDVTERKSAAIALRQLARSLTN